MSMTPQQFTQAFILALKQYTELVDPVTGEVALRVNVEATVADAVGIDQSDPGVSNGVAVVSFPTKTETVSSSVVNSDGSVPAGAKKVVFTTDGSFAGTIAGAARQASTRYEFAVSDPGATLSVIAYTRSAGTMIIDKIQ